MVDKAKEMSIKKKIKRILKEAESFYIQINPTKEEINKLARRTKGYIYKLPPDETGVSRVAFNRHLMLGTHQGAEQSQRYPRSDQRHQQYR